MTNENIDTCLGSTYSQACVLPNSRIVKPTKPVFDSMIIVVDANRIAGFKIGELSDYVALVALGNPPMNSRKSTDSILAVFDGPRVEGSAFHLTPFDRSFLGGLYRSAIDQGAKAQRSTIVNRMTKDMKQGQ